MREPEFEEWHRDPGKKSISMRTCASEEIEMAHEEERLSDRQDQFRTGQATAGSNYVVLFAIHIMHQTGGLKAEGRREVAPRKAGRNKISEKTVTNPAYIPLELLAFSPLHVAHDTGDDRQEKRYHDNEPGA